MGSIEQLILCGQLTDQCVESTARDAADLGYFVTVASDACLAKSLDSHQKGLFGMKGFSRILSTSQVLKELNDTFAESIENAFIIVADDPKEESSSESFLLPPIPKKLEDGAVKALLN